MRKPQNSIGNYPGSDIRALGSRPCDRIPAEHEGISIAIKTHRVEKIAAKVQNPFQPLWWSAPVGGALDAVCQEFLGGNPHGLRAFGAAQQRCSC